MKRILVIDDEEWLRELVQLALTEKGFDVVPAKDGAEGIELARKTFPDLVLCDVNMANVDGYLTLSSLRREPATAAIPFILMTGSADHAGMRHGMELGADDYLAKPFTLDALFGAVDARLRKAETTRIQAERKLTDLRDNISLMLPHELRTPLNGILAYGELLGTEASSLPPSEVAEMGHVIWHSGKRLERLIENFLIYAQLELLSADPQKVAGLQGKKTKTADQVILRCAQAQAEFVHRQSDLAVMAGNLVLPISEDYLVRIVDELVQNAFKFSKAGTPVSVSLVELSASFALEVKDKGCGFSPEHLARIGAYMQFDRKLHEQQGLGLGLTIARRLAELHGGSLLIESDPGVTTKVTVKLPKNGLIEAKEGAYTPRAFRE